ncbi:hypothetical protein BDZ45DRAFT_265592 [Acephala macrosclerotiorum]|nr:hypothetical protein BDZ45DRAFT_265592 [Acephala macrosclerotiorum]
MTKPQTDPSRSGHFKNPIHPNQAHRSPSAVTPTICPVPSIRQRCPVGRCISHSSLQRLNNRIARSQEFFHLSGMDRTRYLLRFILFLSSPSKISNPSHFRCIRSSKIRSRARIQLLLHPNQGTNAHAVIFHTTSSHQDLKIFANPHGHPHPI